MLALLPEGSDRRLKATTQAKIKKLEDDTIATESPLLQEILRRQRKLLQEGVKTTVWAIFASMVNIQTSGTVKPFIAYDYQVELIETIAQNQNIVICKSRQMGISETICCYLLMRAVTEKGFSAVVFSKTQADATELGRRIRDMGLSLGQYCPPLISESATKLQFKGLGKIHFLPVTARAARGLPSVSVVLFDEAAFIDGIDGVYQAAVPTLSMLGDRGKVIFNSTPNGKSGLFYRLLTGGQGEVNKVKQSLHEIKQPAAIDPAERTKRYTRTWVHRKWAKVFLHWRVHPIYGADPEWGNKTRIERQLTEAQWNQEYDLEFSEGQKNVFNHDLVEAGAIAVWEKPKSGHRYLAGVDPNLGGDDFFTAQVIDITAKPFKLVAEYHQNRKTKDYNLISSVALMEPYRPVICSVETNNGGIIYLEEYTKLKKGWRWEGICTTHMSKMANTDRVVLLLERSQYCYPPDSSFAQEAPHFVESTNGKSRTRQAESGHHDDGVMATAIAFANLDEAGFAITDLLSALTR